MERFAQAAEAAEAARLQAAAAAGTLPQRLRDERAALRSAQKVHQRDDIHELSDRLRELRGLRHRLQEAPVPGPADSSARATAKKRARAAKRKALARSARRRRP
jgi:hypothetical protein